MFVLPSTEGHAYVARSWVWPVDRTLRRAELLALAATEGIVRLKGLFRTDEGFVELQVAGGRAHESGTDWRRDSRLDVVVTAERQALLDHLGERLERAVIDPATLAAAGDVIELGEN